MQNLSNLNINTYTPSFRGYLTPMYKVAEKVLREVNRNEYQSATYLRDVRYAGKNYINAHQMGLSELKVIQANILIDLYRSRFANLLKYRSEEDFLRALKSLLHKIKFLNCGEHAYLTYSELRKNGIPCRVVADKNIDHSFVVANRRKPFNSYRDKEKGNFIVDSWLRKIYRNVDEAYLDYKRKFDAQMRAESPVVDITDSPYNYIIDVNMNHKDEIKNEFVISQIGDITDIVRDNVNCEVKTLRKTTEHIKHKTPMRVRDMYNEDMSETIRRHMCGSEFNF